MSQDITLSSQENKNALNTLQWIIYLAELEHRHHITFKGYKDVGWVDAGDLMEGRLSPQELQEQLELRERDPKEYYRQQFMKLSQGLGEAVEKLDKNDRGPGENDIAVKAKLPTADQDVFIKDAIQHDISKKIEEVSDDWYGEWTSERFGDVIWSEEKERRHQAAVRVVRAKQYNNDDLYIQTEDGLSPARQHCQITGKGVTVKDYVVDNTHRSVDQKFYDAKGHETGFNTDGIKQENIVEAVNDFMQCFSITTPFLATALVIGASPVLKGIKAPTADPHMDLRKDHLQRTYGDMAGLYEKLRQKTPDALGEMLHKTEEEIAAFNQKARDFMSAGQALLGQNDADLIDDQSTPDAKILIPFVS